MASLSALFRVFMPVAPGARIPSLDGLRAVSIAMVLFAHVSGTAYFPSFVSLRRDLGNFGVRIFFVISGFLITTLLLGEHAKYGRISLKAFFVRRSLRIFPSAYAYVLVALVLQGFGWLALERNDFFHAVTYTVNYDPERPWHLIHLWSLSVEEQFYLLWPAALCLFGIRLGLRGAALMLLLAPVARVALLFSDEWRWTIGTGFITNADALAIGCVLAGARASLDSNQRYLACLRSAWFVLVPVLGLAASLLLDAEDGRPTLFTNAVGWTIMNVAIALTLDWCVRFHDGRLGRLLNSAPFVSVGVLSYSLYLWQQPFLNRLGSSVINTFPLNLLLCFAAALASYHLVERPFLNLRSRLAHRPAPPVAAGYGIPETRV